MDILKVSVLIILNTQINYQLTEVCTSSILMMDHFLNTVKYSVKFPPSRAGKDIKCSGYAWGVGGGDI